MICEKNPPIILIHRLFFVSFFVLCLVIASPSSWAVAQADTASETEPAVGLAAALQAVMAYNPAIKGMQAELSAHGYAVNSAKASRFPTLSVEANSVTEDYDQGTVRLQQPLWAFGKIDTAIAREKANFSAEQWALLKVQRLLVENTAATYAKVEGIQQRAKVAQVNIEEHDQLYQQVKRRHAGHLASEADMSLAYSRLIQSKSQLVRIRGELQMALTELKGLTQVSVSVDHPVEESLVTLSTVAEVESWVLDGHADVRYKQQRMDVVALDVKGEKVATLPTLYYRVEHEFLDKTSRSTRTSNGLVFEGSIEGLGMTTLGRIKGALARQRAAKEDLNVAKNDVRSRVNSLMVNRLMQQQLSNAQQESISVVESTMESFLRQYQSGRKSWLDVLNTQRELTELRLGLAQIKSDWMIISLRIVALAGGLDQLAGISKMGTESL